MVRTILSALLSLKDEHLKLCEPSNGKNCDVLTSSFIETGCVGKSLSNSGYQGSLVKVNVKDMVSYSDG